MAELLHPDRAELDELLKEKNLLLVDFWATWCGPCRMVAPIIEQVADKYGDKLTVAKVDIDEHGDLAERYGVMSIPTIVLFKNGKEVARDVGARPLAAYTGMVDAHL